MATRYPESALGRCQSWAATSAISASKDQLSSSRTVLTILRRPGQVAAGSATRLEVFKLDQSAYPLVVLVVLLVGAWQDCIDDLIQKGAWMDLIQVGFGAVYAGAVMLALWPRYESGRRFLRRWDVRHPDDEQIAMAVRYLRWRRLPIVPLMLVLPLAKAAVGVRPAGDDPLNVFTLLGSLLVALLLAESLAGWRRPAGGLRIAPLARRSAGDLLPGYAVWLHAALTVVVVGMALAALAVQPAVDRALDRLPPNQYGPDGGSELVLSEELRRELASADSWPVVLGAGLVAAIVVATVWRAAVRPADLDPGIDLVLRVRSARVAVGTGIALTGALGIAAVERLSLVAGFLAGHPRAGPIFGSYPADGPAFPAADPTATGWWDVWSSIGTPVGLTVLLTALLGWVWVANPPLRKPVPSRP